MTDTDNPTGIYTKEVSIYDEDGVIVHPTTEEKQDNAIAHLLTLVTALDEDRVTIDTVHQAIHEKRAFIAHFDGTVTNIGEMSIIAFNAPATTEIHAYFEVSSTHAVDVYLYRDTSLDVDEGTQLNLISRNQADPLGESECLSIETVPVANHMTSFDKTQAANANLTTTSQLRHKVLLGGEGPKAFGAVLEQRTEMIFSNSVQVALVVVAKTNDSSEHTINLSWYEKMRQ